MDGTKCKLKEQGLRPGSCLVKVNDRRLPACQATLRYQEGKIYRLIKSIHLSRPENYLSIYQSGCNFSCRKCHSWYFSKKKDGEWYAPEDILKHAASYEKTVTLCEPREKATAWHAHDTCKCCGNCAVHGNRSLSCPAVINRESILLSPQGFGPARNIVAFTGGDLTCCPDFYAKCTSLIKRKTRLWVLIETNGYGLTPQNLDYLKESGVDAFWLDIKAWDDNVHKWLTGCSNKDILKLPKEIKKRGLVLEVLSLYIPELVEVDQLEKIAKYLSIVDPEIPFTVLAFFPEYQMKSFRGPTVEEMADAYQKARSAGMKNIRLGNLGVFIRSEENQKFLISNVDKDAF